LEKLVEKEKKRISKLIINSSYNIESLIKNRDEREKKLYCQLINEFSLINGLYERLFDKFCSLFLKIRKTYNLKKDYFILDFEEK
jgi:hypothetical protein